MHLFSRFKRTSTSRQRRPFKTSLRRIWETSPCSRAPHYLRLYFFFIFLSDFARQRINNSTHPLRLPSFLPLLFFHKLFHQQLSLPPTILLQHEIVFISQTRWTLKFVESSRLYLIIFFFHHSVDSPAITIILQTAPSSL